jgi:electron transfer flavoprotein alpha subunit
VIAVGDVRIEIELRIRLRGTVKELAAFMETLNSSAVVVGIGGEMRGDGEKCEKAQELCEQLGAGTGKRG